MATQSPIRLSDLGSFAADADDRQHWVVGFSLGLILAIGTMLFLVVARIPTPAPVTTASIVHPSIPVPVSQHPAAVMRIADRFPTPRIEIVKPLYPYAGLIRAAGHRYGLDPNLIAGVIRIESDFDRHCVSPTGAVGLMQMEPATAWLIARHLGIAHYDLFDPRTNIMLGACHLHGLMLAFNGNVASALSYYNGGSRSMIADGVYRNPHYIEAVLYHCHQYEREAEQSERLALLPE